jgi:hypothetical protein
MRVLDGLGPPAQVGESARDGDMDVNPVREKKLTNVRAAGNDEKVIPYPTLGRHLPSPRIWMTGFRAA